MNNLKPTVVSWFFNQTNGKLELDCYLEVTEDTQHDVRMIFLRSRTQPAQVSLLHIPLEAEREDIENYVKHDKDAVKLLNKAKISEHELYRNIDTRGNAVDFLKNFTK